MAGRPKKPLALVRMEGNPGKRKLPKPHEEIKPDPAHLSPPAWMDKDAKVEWLRVEPELFKLGLFTKLDLAMLAMYCQSYSRVIEAERKDQSDKANKYMTQIHRACAAFGMHPSARAKMSIPGKEDEDEMDNELTKHAGS